MPGAIAEEIDYTMSNTNIVVGGYNRRLLGNETDSFEQVGLR